MENKNMQIETHPWVPFIPEGARVLIMGTFPPGKNRWNMDFYYPNRTNDFWKIMGLIFLNDPNALLRTDSKDYDLEKIKKLMTEKGVALNDTGYKIRRLKGNASDKFLEIVEPVDLNSLLLKMPLCKGIASTGEKAAGVIAKLTDSEIPRMGEFVKVEGFPEIWRMPSTSRAYPMKITEKAEYYIKMFRHIGII